MIFLELGTSALLALLLVKNNLVTCWILTKHSAKVFHATIALIKSAWFRLLLPPLCFLQQFLGFARWRRGLGVHSVTHMDLPRDDMPIHGRGF